MSDDKKNPQPEENDAEVSDEQLEQVSGGKYYPIPIIITDGPGPFNPIDPTFPPYTTF